VSGELKLKVGREKRLKRTVGNKVLVFRRDAAYVPLQSVCRADDGLSVWVEAGNHFARLGPHIRHPQILALSLGERGCASARRKTLPSVRRHRQFLMQ
jgi:hypothetical protein